ncbi:MAG: DUF1912 family protein [Streptococcaceae bacterium]|jgi:uncharacterized alpha/beta hydrolase family protein|nr:DUF1912 family protein [Streptococcaceae bacterium]
MAQTESEFLSELENFVSAQLTIMEKARQIAADEKQTDAEIRYESRLSAYEFLRGKFDNFHAGKKFSDL